MNCKYMVISAIIKINPYLYQIWTVSGREQKNFGACINYLLLQELVINSSIRVR